MKASSQQQAPTSGTPAEPSGTPVNPELLRWLADANGVGTTYQGWDGNPHDVAPATLIRVLGEILLAPVAGA